MIRAWIPGYRAVEAAGSGRPHHVYTVHVALNGKLHKVHKRYSAFHKLYHLFRKQYVTECEFPPKRLRNNNSKVLEVRRAALECWLQEALAIHPTPPLLLHFLQVEQRDDMQEECHQLPSSHQAVLTFSCDPFLPDCKAPLGVVEAGVFAALYNTELLLPF